MSQPNSDEISFSMKRIKKDKIDISGHPISNKCSRFIQCCCCWMDSIKYVRYVKTYSWTVPWHKWIQKCFLFVVLQLTRTLLVKYIYSFRLWCERWCIHDQDRGIRRQLDIWKGTSRTERQSLHICTPGRERLPSVSAVWARLCAGRWRMVCYNRFVNERATGL